MPSSLTSLASSKACRALPEQGQRLVGAIELQQRVVVAEPGLRDIGLRGIAVPLAGDDLGVQVQRILPPVQPAGCVPADVEQYLADVPRGGDLALAWRGGQGVHVGAQPPHLSQHLADLSLSHRVQHLQPRGLVEQLGPRPVPGLPGVADHLAGEVTGLGEPPVATAQVDQPHGSNRRRRIVAAGRGGVHVGTHLALGLGGIDRHQHPG